MGIFQDPRPSLFVLDSKYLWLNICLQFKKKFQSVLTLNNAFGVFDVVHCLKTTLEI